MKRKPKIPEFVLNFGYSSTDLPKYAELLKDLLFWEIVYPRRKFNPRQARVERRAAQQQY